MKTLADEILMSLPALMAEFPLGPTILVLCNRLAAASPDVRRAVEQIDKDGRAVRYRWSKAHHLVPCGYEPNGMRICGNCRSTFYPPKTGKRISPRVTCSPECHVSLSWKHPGTRERRLESIKAERATPLAQARTAAHNARRWADPEQRRKLSEWNRKRWADPATKAKLSAAIQAVNGSPEGRALFSKNRKAQWCDPEFRDKTVAGIRKSKRTPEARAKFSKLLKLRWDDPEKRNIYLAGVQKTAAKMAERNKGRKQSKETIRKRVAATKATKAAAGVAE
jgi:hypothetical protein